MSAKKYLQTINFDYSRDTLTVINIIINCLEEPIRQIARNAGVDEGVIVDKVYSSKKQNFGYDAQSGTYCDMLEAGIVDPTKVEIVALENAISVVSTMLTTETIVLENPQNAQN